MCDSSVWTGVQALHVTMHASDGAREHLGRKKKTATGRLGASYFANINKKYIYSGTESSIV